MAKIMLVDDDPQFLYLIGKQLDTASGYKKVVCTGGEDALNKIPTEKPDLIMLDVMMPGVDGFTVCEKIRAMPDMKFVSIIFVTAKRETEDKIKGGIVGADDYITKPVEPQELLRRIRVQLKIREMQILLSMAREEMLESVDLINDHVNLLKSGSSASDEERGESLESIHERADSFKKLVKKISKVIPAG